MSSYLTTLETPRVRSAEPSAGAPRALRPGERPRIVDWLDGGLRKGQSGALEREYPLSMGAKGSRIHRVIFEGTKPIAHAMLHPTTLLARGRRLPVGLIGNVYTDPAYRGRGLGTACVEACTAEARRRSLALALLWSELDGFYDRLGFTPAGCETYLAIDADIVARAREGLPAQLRRRMREGRCVSAATTADFPSLDRIYAEQPIRNDRPPGSLALLSQAPGTRIVVDRGFKGVRAYAVLGRGTDFPGVIHEWAGDSAGVLACLSELCRTQDSLLMLAGPEPSQGEMLTRLRGEGAPAQTVPFALVRLVDIETLWSAITPAQSRILLGPCDPSHREASIQLTELNGSNSAEISAEAAVRMLFEGLIPVGLPGSLEAMLRDDLADTVPWPLYLWGFDSI